jgi:GDPmannose 4,6-dehydratase
LNSKKDWGFAKEYVVGMWKMLQQEQPDDYVLATGQSHTVRDFVEYAASALDLDIKWEGEGLREIGINRKNNKILVSVNPDYYRPEEVDVKIANAKKAAEKLDWNASTNVRELAKIMVEFDLNRLKFL